MKSNRDYIET